VLALVGVPNSEKTPKVPDTIIDPVISYDPDKVLLFVHIPVDADA
jgi:hypothetical protein